MRIILASQSPRRQSLLADAGISFAVVPSPAEELRHAGLLPGALCEENARRKALAVAADVPGAVVIGADTLVFLDHEPVGKPCDLEDARSMLAALSGRTHEVITGVCLAIPESQEIVFHDVTEVRFKTLSDALIERYLQHTTPLDKAGAYGIQDHGDWLIERFSGSYDNVMGLPVKRLLATMEGIGLRVRAN